MKFLAYVRVAPGLDYECLVDPSIDIRAGTQVVAMCERYQDMGTVIRCNCETPVDEKAVEKERSKQKQGRRIEGRNVPRIVRAATDKDRERWEENVEREASMFEQTRTKIVEHALDMKLVDCHLAFDRKLVVFQFTADGRVDFRALVRDLSQLFHTRVELRQVGVRDETGIQGGIGCCGRPFCCATFLHEFVSINVRMAKAQGLSLNPSNISGACGRLKCCLRYEAEGYKDMRRGLPKNGSHVETPAGLGKVLDVNMLCQKVKVRLEDGHGKVAIFPVDEVERSRAPQPPEKEKPREQQRTGGSGNGGGRKPQAG
jgi:cell fate regulator YaaT (PSP1 superfamily)